MDGSLGNTGTAQRGVEREALRLSEQTARAFLDTPFDAAGLLDTEGVLLDANEALARRFGRQVRELRGVHIRSLMQAQVAERCMQRFSEVVRQGNAVRFEDCCEGAWTDTVLSPIVDTSGRVSRIALLARDISDRKQAEKELERLRLHTELVLDAAGEGIFGLDTEGRHTFVNPAAARMLGFEVGELLGKPSHGIWHHTRPDGEPYPEQACPIYSAYRDGSVRSGDNERFWRKDGSSFPAEYTSTPIREGGNVVGAVVVFRDITLRNQAEQEIRRRNRELTLLNRVISASASGMAPTGVLETACRELALTLDLPQSAVALLNSDRSAAVVAAEYVAAGRPPALGAVIPVAGNPLFELVLSKRTPLLVEDARHDERLAVVRDLLRQRGTVSLLVVPLVVDGEVVGTIGLDSLEPRSFSNEEVTLARNVAGEVAGCLARASLTETRQRLQTAIEQSAESVVITDAAGAIVYVNPAFERITGYGAAEAIGANPRILKSGLHDDELYRTLWSTISAGETWRGRLVNRRKDGTLFTEDAVITPVRDAGGQIVSYVGLQRDVTEEVRLEESYRRSQKLESIGRLAGGMAHDFNNLLAAIMGYAQLALATLSADDPLRSDLQEIEEMGERGSALTKQLLTFARRQTIEPELLDLNHLIIDCDRMLRRLIGENIELVTLPADDLGAVLADRAQLEQVVLNLVVNARDAMPDGGTLTIATANLLVTEEEVRDAYTRVTPGAYVLLSVRDTGTGMDGNVKAHLFEPFFTTKAPGKGTGLGLATCFGIVTRSEGHIRVASEPGRGTTVEVLLPRVSGEPLRLGTAEAEAERSGSEWVLLVEDEASVRRMARKVLSRHGYQVLEAANGEEALRLLEQGEQEIELVLTDVVMPIMGGHELVGKLQAMRPELPVVMMSGYDELQEAGAKVGISCMRKPFTSQVLLRTVREALDAGK